MTNRKIIEGLIQCHSLLTDISNSPFDAFAALNARETVFNALRFLGDFNTGAGADPGKLSDLRRLTIIRLYVIAKSVPAGKLAEPAGDEQLVAPLNEIIDRINLFLNVAKETDYKESPAVSSPHVHHPVTPAPSGSADVLPQADTVS